ncbi:hypothetical protein HETIRDRAFT_419706 [Heterobasidion irregulare TC 32-1]|uniref:Uncharacterized protein n=1 Tax=Heterobasidion irregulare (strain TC 32-1) TaxID=747525 RepID=W4K4Z7_HETIT|nr:uncharacterized protein HETIRDRAFT_419706 [Heterobasidion irregulare TC 32-1]ETW80126.1 hypothetical protein HETIRDRAFT_419706 [Heterobasidion irregulare TC 32-1]
MVRTWSPGVQATPRRSRAVPSVSRSRYSARLKHACQEGSMSRRPNTPVECRRCREERCVFLRLVFKQGHAGEWISICRICDDLWYPPQDLPPAEQVARIEEIRADDERICGDGKLAKVLQRTFNKEAKISGRGGAREKTVAQFSQSQGTTMSEGTEGGSSPVWGGHTLTSPVPSMDDFFGEGAEDSQDEGGGVLHTNNGLDRWVRVVMWTAANATPEIVLCKAPYSFFKFTEHRRIMAEMGLRRDQRWDRWNGEECRWEICLNIDKEIWVSEREHSILGRLAGTPGCVGLGAEIQRLADGIEGAKVGEDSLVVEHKSVGVQAGEVGNKRAGKKRGIEEVEVMEGSSGLSIDEKEVVAGRKAHAAAKGKRTINVYRAISEAPVADELVTPHLIIEDGKEIYDLTWEW